MTLAEYRALRVRVIEAGFADDITWAQTVCFPSHPTAFAVEYAFVICNSGMRATVARQIFDRVREALFSGRDATSVFKHGGKASAIDRFWQEREKQFAAFKAVAPADRVEWLGKLPWIGSITKYHLAKNCGVDCCKPDRHLVRVAAKFKTTPEELCQRLAHESGDRIGTVDLVIWRAASEGLLSV